MKNTMEREIEAQRTMLAEIQPSISKSAESIRFRPGRVFAGGCGDSAYAPRALSSVFEAIGQPFVAKTSMELAAFTTFRTDDTVIISSISGGTKRSVVAAKEARRAGAQVVAITCNADSALAKVADDVLHLPFRPISRKTPHTLDYSVTLLALVELARNFSGADAAATKTVLADVGEALSLARTAAKRVVEGYDASGKIFVLGAGPDLGTAEYGAAKFQEAGGLLAMAAETENFAHGANFMLEDGDTVIALGGTTAGLLRARQIVDALDRLAINRHVFPSSSLPKDGWDMAFLSVLEQTFFLQYVCLGVSERLCLRLEEPRAGRSGGLAHQSMQQRMMTC